MPICQNCKREFPNRKKIDGQKRNLSSRKYCLDCSPFGNHNTQKLHLNPKDEKNEYPTVMECSLCETEYKYSPNEGKSKSYCQCCQIKRKRISYKQATVSILGGACDRCGYSSCFSALVFHHIDEEKSFNMRSMIEKSYETIAEEIKKCQLLCANCHHMHHCNGYYGYCPEHRWEETCCNKENPCNNACKNQFLRRQNRRDAIQSMGGECEKCGYSGCVSAFVFHHMDGDSKKFGLNVTAFSRSKENINKELQKCQLLCQNCHNKSHCDCNLRFGVTFEEYYERVKSSIINNME